MQNAAYAILVIACSLLIGCSDEAEIKQAATWACEYGQEDKPTLEFLPKDQDPTKFIRAEDLEFIADQTEAEDENPFAELGNAMLASMKPAGRALIIARSEVVGCAISEVKIEGSTASAKLEVTLPELEEGTMKRFGELSEMDSSAERVAEAKKWFEEAESEKTTEHSLKFVKEEAGWRLNYSLPQAAAKQARIEQLLEDATTASIEGDLEKAKSVLQEAAKIDPKNEKVIAELKEVAEMELNQKVRDLTEEALEASNTYKFEEAKRKLEEAIELKPEDEELKEMVTNVETARSNLVAGRWMKNEQRDAMTDDANISVMLPASNQISGTFDKKRPTMVVRCAEKKFSFYIFIGMGVDSDYGELYRATGRVRFGNEDAEKVRLGIGDSRETVFFRGEKSWFNRVVEGESKFVLEVPLYRVGKQAIEFDTSGAKEVHKLISEACL